MKARELTEEALAKEFHLEPIMPALRACGGAINDILDTNASGYYQWTPRLLEILKPKQIVELGGAMGAWDLMVLNGKYQDFKLYSITLEDTGLSSLLS